MKVGIDTEVVRDVLTWRIGRLAKRVENTDEFERLLWECIQDTLTECAYPVYPASELMHRDSDHSSLSQAIHHLLQQTDGDSDTSLIDMLVHIFTSEDDDNDGKHDN